MSEPKAPDDHRTWQDYQNDIERMVLLVSQLDCEPGRALELLKAIEFRCGEQPDRDMGEEYSR